MTALPFGINHHNCISYLLNTKVEISSFDRPNKNLSANRFGPKMPLHATVRVAFSNTKLHSIEQ